LQDHSLKTIIMVLQRNISETLAVCIWYLVRWLAVQFTLQSIFQCKD
jgi:hypothetical protein